MRPDALWSNMGGPSVERAASHDLLALFDTYYPSPSDSDHLPSSITRPGTSPLTNPYGILHHGNIFSNMGTNTYPSQGDIGPLKTTERVESPFTVPRFNELSRGGNALGGLNNRQTGQELMKLAQQTPSTSYAGPLTSPFPSIQHADSCECTLEHTCYLHRPRRSTPPDTSDFGSTPSEYFCLWLWHKMAN